MSGRPAGAAVVLGIVDGGAQHQDRRHRGQDDLLLVAAGQSGDHVGQVTELQVQASSPLLGLRVFGARSQQTHAAERATPGGGAVSGDGGLHIGLGHERIVFLTGPFSIDQTRRRHMGLCKAVTEADLDPRTAITVVDVPQLNLEQGEKAMDAVLAGGPRQRSTAVFCANDQLALGFLKGLGRRGLGAPDDISVVGYDDIDVAALVHPGLTTVAQPKYKLGRTAMSLLREHFEDPEHRHERRLFTPEIALRGSTAAHRA